MSAASSKRHSDSQTTRHLTFGDALRSGFSPCACPFRYFRRYPSGPDTKTLATPLHEGNASFTDGVRRVMPLKRFLFRSPLPADTHARRSLLLLLLLTSLRPLEPSRSSSCLSACRRRSPFLPMLLSGVRKV